MIVGLPDMFDALVIPDPSGDSQVFLDLSNWVVYERKHNIGNVVHNLLTHGPCHVCIGAIFRKIEADSESADYITRIYAMTFNEGFAHLVSYDDTPIDRSDRCCARQLLQQVCRERCGRAARLHRYSMDPAALTLIISILFS